MFFSLLVKELVEHAQRRRTFVVRTLFATAAICLAGYVYHDIVTVPALSPQGATSVLGRGRELLAWVFGLMAGTEIVLLPALLAPSLTAEKERGTLAPLLLTRLGPGQIVWQKFCSQGLAVASLGLVCLPLMAVAYSLGGFEAGDILLAVWHLAVLALLVGGIALLIGSLARGTVSAILGSYGVLAVLWLVPLVLIGLDWRWRRQADLLFLFQPIYHFYASYAGSAAGSWPVRLGGHLGDAGPSLGLAVACLLVARAAVRPLQRRTYLRPWWRRLKRWLQARVRGRHSLNEVDSLECVPVGRPVRWLERRRNWMAKPLVQMYFTIFTSYGCLLLALYLGDYSSRTYWRGWEPSEEQMLVQALAWLVMVLVLTVAAADSFGREIGRGTLRVLLTTPLPARAIVREKLAALRPLRWMLRGPLVILPLSHHLFIDFDAVVGITICHLFLAAILPLEITWACVWWSLRARTRTRAILGALALVFGSLILGAGALILLIWSTDLQQDSLGALLVFLHPGGLWLFSMVTDLSRFLGGPELPVLLAVVWHSGLLAFLRWRCLHNVRERLLRCVE